MEDGWMTEILKHPMKGEHILLLYISVFRIEPERITPYPKNLEKAREINFFAVPCNFLAVE